MTYGAKPYFRTDSYVQQEFSTGQVPLVSQPIVVLAGQVNPAGTVIGKITASGKWVKSVRTANDGSQVPKGVTAVDVDATGGDVKSAGYKRGEFIFEGLNVDGTWTYDQLFAALDGSGLDLVHGIVPQND